LTNLRLQQSFLKLGFKDTLRDLKYRNVKENQIWSLRMMSLGLEERLPLHNGDFRFKNVFGSKIVGGIQCGLSERKKRYDKNLTVP